MQKITPNLWFNGNAGDGAKFYTDTFRNSKLLSTTIYPSDGSSDLQQGKAGQVLLPLGEYGHSPHYGWVQDKFGVTWQLMLTDPDGDPRPFIVPNLTFGGDVQNRARQARDLYISTFPQSLACAMVEYPVAVGAAASGAVMFCDFTLSGQWLSVMDSAVPQEFSFTEAVSLSVACADQAELDRIWAALSHDPNTEQCGWCTDEFGVSWQVLPDNMEELMNRPGAYSKLMAMKKIEIAEF